MADQSLSSPRKAAYAVAALFSVLMVMHMLRGSEASTGGGQVPLPGKGGEPTFQRTIVAVGDLHGDYPNMMTVLKMAKVVSENGTWTGDVDYLVQTGDIVDRGDDTLKMYRYLEKLRVEAQQAGGDIRSHFGNHEVMNLIGDWRYVPQSEILTFGGVEARQQMLAKGWLAQAWRANYTITTRLPLHPSLGPINTDYDPGKAGRLQDISHAAVSFLHGGLSPTYDDLTPYPSRINGLGASLVQKLQERRPLPPPHPPNRYPGLPVSATDAEHELYGGNGPLWYRGWAMDKDHVVCSKVDAVMQKLGVRHLVMGHTPNFTGIVSRCGGKILLIDTGISHAYGGVLSAAKFTYTLTPTKRKGFWIESEMVTAIYEEKEEVLVNSEREIQADFI